MISLKLCRKIGSLYEMITKACTQNASFLYVPLNEKPTNHLQRLSFSRRNFRCLCSLVCSSSDPKSSSCGGFNVSSCSSATHRVSRFARSEAQSVLFDYLHSTRGFSSPDAEYISKNSPRFVEKLLSKIDSNKDIGRSLMKFLWYNPINEFEPFFESLGLSPSKIRKLLPTDLMFLNDDDRMMKNFRTLCEYGIPRCKMGKILAEARDVFDYEYGVLSPKLQDIENLGFDKSAVVKLVSCCPQLLVGSTNLQFSQVVEKMRGLGIENDLVAGFPDRKCYSWCRMLDTIDFLENIGYGKQNMATLFKANPTLLFDGSGKKVYIFFGQLLKLGINVNEAHKLFAENPLILCDQSVKNLSRAVRFLFEIGMEAGDIANIIFTQPKLFSSRSLKQPVAVCKRVKGGRHSLLQIIRNDPMEFLQLASKPMAKSDEKVYQDQLKHMEKMNFLLRLGFVENSEELTKASKQFRGRGDKLQERFDCLIQAGLNFDDASKIIRQAPAVLNQSKDVIQEKINYFTKCLGYPPDKVVEFPPYLCYDMGRINRRFSMYAWLRERGAVKSMSLSSILASSHTRFVKYFVDIHPEGSTIWETLTQSS